MRSAAEEHTPGAAARAVRLRRNQLVHQQRIPKTDKLVAVHAPEDDLMWGDDEGPLAFCTNLLRDADQ